MKKKNLLTIILIFNIVALLLIITNKLETSIIKCLLLIPLFIPMMLKISINDTIEKMYLILIFLSSTLGTIWGLIKFDIDQIFKTNMKIV